MKQNCPICGGDIYPFLTREKVPCFQNVVFADQLDAVQSANANLEMAACKQCGFIFNQSFDLGKVDYNENYENCQSYSGCFTNHVDKLVKYLLDDLGIQKSKIIEIGCGQGNFIKSLVENPDYGNYGIGFDPSYRGEEVILDGRLKFCRNYYSEQYADIQADIIICRHVIEHIPSPVEFLQDIFKAVRGNPNVKLFFETPCVNWILENGVFWDFFYEHCSYFNEASIRIAFSQAGFSIKNIEHLFGGQYLWIEASPQTASGEPIQNQINWQTFKTDIDSYTHKQSIMVNEWEQVINSLRGAGKKVAIWGAGAKGVTFVNLIDQEREKISCLIDINPNKQEKYVAGTGHLITSVENAVRMGITHAIVMNPNYITEIQETLNKNGIGIQLVKHSIQ